MHWLAALLREKTIRPFILSALIAAALSPLLMSLPVLIAPAAMAQTPVPAEPAPAPSADAVPKPAAPASSSAAAPAEAQEKTTGPRPQKVEVGFYPNTVYQLDIAANTFKCDFYVWFIWEGDLDPTQSLEFVNGVDETDISKVLVHSQPEKLPDGRWYQTLRVEGKFFQPFHLGSFPFDQHNLSLIVEDNFNTTEDLIYTPDKKNSGVGDMLIVPGWKREGWELKTGVRHYPTNFGDTRDGVGGSDYSQARFEITISRPLNYFLLKLFLPMVIVLVLAWGALLLAPDKVEGRTALSATALLTAVFLQLGYASTLPEMGYLTLLDKIYLLVYVLILAVLFESIITARWVRISQESPESVARARKLDRFTLTSEVAIFVIGVTLLLVL